MESDVPDPNSRQEHPTLSSALLVNVQQMDPASWSRLVNTFGPIVYRWCRTSGVNEAEASDVVQEVFAAVARGIHQFTPEKSQGSFRSWLATVTRNKVRDYFRRQAKGQAHAEGGTQALVRLQQQPEDLDSTICADAMDSPIMLRVLEQVRAEFESTTWDAFWQTTIEGKAAADVSENLGIATASVYQAKSRILRRLRQCLSELPE